MSILPSPLKRPNLAFYLVSSACLTFAPLPSFACSMASGKMSALQIRRQAQSSFERSSAIVDAEVISPMDSGKSIQEGVAPIAFLRVIKSYKGEVGGDIIPVVYISSCDISLEEKGQMVRVLLVGNEVYRADQGMNGAGVSDLAEFNRELDRLVGQRRVASFAQFPGEIAPNNKAEDVH